MTVLLLNRDENIVENVKISHHEQFSQFAIVFLKVLKGIRKCLYVGKIKNNFSSINILFITQLQ